MTQAAFTSQDLDRIQAESFVRRVDLHPELPSTNDRALDLTAQEYLQTPLLVLAERQTAGRGRGANRWWSSSGALTFSLIIEATAAGLPADRWPQLSLTAGVAVCEAVRDLLPPAEVGLKWPNDVYVNGRKACGILVEASARRGGRLVVGIGLNVNNSFSQAPDSVRAIATSLGDTAHCVYDLTDTLIRVLKQLSDRFDLLKTSDPRLPQFWRDYSLLDGRTIHLEAGSRRVVGVCRGIDDQGALILQTETGSERFFGGVIVKS